MYLVAELVRGTAGKKEVLKRALAHIKLTKPGQRVVLENTSTNRGILRQVAHLVRVVSLEEEQQRIADINARLEPKAPITVKHDVASSGA